MKALWIRILFSVFIVYHLIAVVVLANSESFLGRSLSGWIHSYGSVLGLNAHWSFFAPNPPEQRIYFHYNIQFDDDEGHEAKDSVDGFVPAQREQFVFPSSERRFLYAFRFLIFDEKRARALFGPYLCRQHPGATRIHLENIFEPLPTLDASRIGEMQKSSEMKLMDISYRCGEVADEVPL